jgi:hypothetical protein
MPHCPRPRRATLRRVLLTAAASLPMALLPGLAGAAASEADPPSGLQFTLSGFYTLAAAMALRSKVEDTPLRLRCDCFVSEYSQGGVIEDGRVGFEGDSKLGLQAGIGTPDGRWSVTGQVVARGARDGRVNLEWLYATHEIDGHWTLQLGRKRLPLLSMSEVQDVGVAFPWVRLPPQIYGWDIVNYNGANVRWRGTLGAMALSANVFAGRELVEDSAFEALYYTDGTKTDTRWSGIRGLEVELGWGDARVRGAALEARRSSRYTYPGEPRTAFDPAVPLRIATLAASLEPEPWLLRAEYLYGDRSQEWGIDRGWLLAAGRRFGDLQLVLTRSYYMQTPNELIDFAEGNSMNSIALRWDAAPGLAWKLQLDDTRDRSSPNFTVGSRRLLTVAVTGTF